MAEQLGNSGVTPTSTLASAVAADAVSLTVATGQGDRFPDTGNFRVKLTAIADATAFEWVLVGARTDDVLEDLERGIEGSTAQAFAAGAYVDIVLTAGGLETYVAENAGGSPYHSEVAPIMLQSVDRCAVTPGVYNGLFYTFAPDDDYTYDPGAGGVGATLTSDVNGVIPGIDGAVPDVGDRIAFVDGSFNGIYVVTSVGSVGAPWVLTRATDCDTEDEIVRFWASKINAGTVLAGGTVRVTTAFDGWSLSIAGPGSTGEGLAASFAPYTHAEGGASVAASLFAHAEGDQTHASAGGAHSEGSQTGASGVGAHAEGVGTQAGSFGAHAEGESTSAAAEASHAEGQSTQANGVASHAEGSASIASNLAAHAEGISTQASGPGSHTEGLSTLAGGQFAHAEGDTTSAGAHAAHAEGAATTANGYASHAEGEGTVAGGEGAHAEGEQTVASSAASHAEGYGAAATRFGSHAHSSVGGGRQYTRQTYAGFTDNDTPLLLQNAQGNHCVLPSFVMAFLVTANVVGRRSNGVDAASFRISALILGDGVGTFTVVDAAVFETFATVGAGTWLAGLNLPGGPDFAVVVTGDNDAPGITWTATIHLDEINDD